MMSQSMAWVSMDLSPDVEAQIGKNTPWIKVPQKIKEMFGNSQKGYDKAVVAYSIRNQLRYSENLVKTIVKNEPKYYEDIVQYSKERLMLYPYHLSDRVVKGLRITPFQYYISVLEKIMEQEKSYDSLPNFTAADCLRLLGIGRNQYIELMNQHRSSRKLFRRKPPRELLPTKPVDITIEPWFLVQHGYITEEDITATKADERTIIDNLIDNGSQMVGTQNFSCVHSLYRKGLVYIDVPVEDNDYIVVPPLEGFVMNRVLGDYFETLLYKIFVSIDEHTTVSELASVLDIQVQLIKNAVSLYCRLGFAYKKNIRLDINTLDVSWKDHLSHMKNRLTYTAEEESLLADELESAVVEDDTFPSDATSNKSSGVPFERSKSSMSISSDNAFFPGSQTSTSSKRIAFLFDSTLTAFLMMGNLSPGLKNHAVTMFEVGKMADESLDSFLIELDNVEIIEGEGHQDTTVVNMYFYNTGFEFDDKKGQLTLHAHVEMMWIDEHIKWDPLYYGNLSILHFYPTELWRPDIMSYNDLGKGELDHFGNTLIYSTNFSVLYWIPPAKFIVGCEVDYYRFPYDMHRCRIDITAWSHNGADVILMLAANHSKMDEQPFLITDKPMQNREWNLVDNSLELKDFDNKDTFPEIVITMDIQRRSSTHVSAVLLVAFGIAITILISFWLNPFSKERLPVILVALFLNTMYLNQVSIIIPNNGSRVPWLVCYFRDSLIMVTTALAWSVIIRYIAKTKRNAPLPLWIDKILDGYIGCILCLNPRPTKSQQIIEPEGDDQDELVNKQIFYKGDWGWFASILDRICFFFYLIVYFCFIISF